ncbi:DMT family transporter [Neomicrococcus lactis]
MSKSLETKRRVTQFSTPVGLIAAVFAGMFAPAQGRVNGALSTALGDGMPAALISFVTGLVAVSLVLVLTRSGRESMRELPTMIREKTFPWWYMLAGLIGAYYVLAQTITVPIVGVALFTVANIAGRTVSGLLTDSTGFAGGDKRRITFLQVLGSVLAIIGVIWAVWPSLISHGASTEWLLPILFPISAGFFFAFQQAMNGTQTKYYGTPIPATFFNFASGTVALGVVVLISTLVEPVPGHFPSEWWMYTGGLLGAVFIAVSALLVRYMGTLLTGLGFLAGQLLGSIALDLLVPVEGSSVTFYTISGTFLTLVAVIVASLPSKARATRQKR